VAIQRQAELLFINTKLAWK